FAPSEFECISFVPQPPTNRLQGRDSDTSQWPAGDRRGPDRQTANHRGAVNELKLPAVANSSIRRAPLMRFASSLY
ncbi:hypothetical protein TNIN_442111, partial [Trichonephila inaurata madagascariensis]